MLPSVSKCFSFLEISEREKWIVFAPDDKTNDFKQLSAVCSGNDNCRAMNVAKFWLLAQKQAFEK